MANCRICGKSTHSGHEFCELHEKAYFNLKKQYPIWKTALGLEWEIYLNEVLKNPLTGMSVKEVALYLLSD